MTDATNKNTAIDVKNIVKTFHIPLDGGSGIKQKIIHFLKRKKGYRVFMPLNDVSFTIEKGDFFGIVGRNGSGKSTLLKTIAGIYTPDTGAIEVNGTLVPFIELGVGFNPELTGRENVFLNGALLGFNRKQMESMYDEIVEFAELGDFMEERLKNYSSGMQVRLAFSIAIRAKGDILLLDEVLAVGDAAFQRKCYEYFETLKDQKKTVILVTHSMSAVEQFCNKGMLLNEGRVELVGTSSQVADAYENLFIKKKVTKKPTTVANPVVEQQDKTMNIEATLRQNGEVTQKVTAGVPFTVRLDITPNVTITDSNIVLNIKNYRNDVLCAVGTDQFVPTLPLKKGDTISVDFDIDNIFTNGNYSVNLGIDEVQGTKRTLVYKKNETITFVIEGVEYHKESLTHPNVAVNITGVDA